MAAPRIIRDDNAAILPSPAMLALMIDWGVDTEHCGVNGCPEFPNTVIRQDSTLFGLCEEHYQASLVPGGARFTLARYARRQREPVQ